MVNYRYVLTEVERNHEAFVNEGRVTAASPVMRLARGVRAATEPAPAGGDAGT
jgi:malonyl-CoA decarboxylase